MDTILDTILTNTYTLSRLNKRVRLLNQSLSNKLYSAKFDLSKQGLVEKQDLDWLNNLEIGLIENITTDSFNSIFKDLSERIKQLKILVLYLALEQPEDEIENIGKYVRQNFNQNIILDIKLDPSLLGGCAIVWNGIYRDYSIRKKIEEEKVTILATLKAFLK